MHLNSTCQTLCLLVCGLTLLTPLAQAAECSATDQGQSVFNLPPSAVSLEAAITAARHAVAGTPVEAHWCNDNKSGWYSIYMADRSSHTVTQVKVDATTSKTIELKTWHIDGKKTRSTENNIHRGK